MLWLSYLGKHGIKEWAARHGEDFQQLGMLALELDHSNAVLRSLSQEGLDAQILGILSAGSIYLSVYPGLSQLQREPFALTLYETPGSLHPILEERPG